MQEPHYASYDKDFVTKDVGLAAYLQLVGFKIQDYDVVREGRSGREVYMFVFENNQSLNDHKDDYLSGRALANPLAHSQGVRSLIRYVKGLQVSRA